MSDTIKCGNCGKDSEIERVESDGKNAFALQQIGWISKLPIYFSITEWLFTCSLDCHEKLFQQKCVDYNVSQEMIDEGKKHLAELKAKIPQMAQQTGDFMAKVQKVLKGEK